jgi:hypothetical protein
MKPFVNVQNSLDVVIAGRKLVETDEWIAKRGGINDGGSTGPPCIDVQAEELHTRSHFFAKLKARLLGFVCGNAQEDVAVKGLGAKGAGEGNLKAELATRSLGEGAGGGEKASDEEKQDSRQRVKFTCGFARSKMDQRGSPD